MNLWRPTRKWIKSQTFGQNATSYYSENQLIGHPGEDYVGNYDDLILSLSDGKVSRVINKDDKNYRYRCVSILTENYEITYGHLNGIYVKEGDVVKSGEAIGSMGNTGDVFVNGNKITIEERKKGSKAGTHLHLQVRELVIGSTLKPLAPKNGYNGCVNPERFYSKYSIDDMGTFTRILSLIEQLFGLKGRTL